MDSSWYKYVTLTLLVIMTALARCAGEESLSKRQLFQIVDQHPDGVRGAKNRCFDLTPRPQTW